MTNKMNTSRNSLRQTLTLSLLPGLAIAVLNLLLAPAVSAADAPKDSAADTGNQVPLMLKLPAPAFKGTPKDMQLGPNVEPVSDKPRPPMMVPPGLKNLAPGSKITCSDKNVPADNLAKLTDGDKEASDQSIIFLRKGTQWVQLDLGSPQEIFAVVIWHAHNSAKVYHNVIVQVADDPDFIENVRTVFNNDNDNTLRPGRGDQSRVLRDIRRQAHRCQGRKSPLHPLLLEGQHRERPQRIY